MRSSDQEKSDLLKLLLEIISRISDKSYQKRVWIEGAGPEVDDFDETVCWYSSSVDHIFREYAEYGISNMQMELLKEFHREFKKFWKKNDLPQSFIDTPEWTQITFLAKEVLQAFDYPAVPEVPKGCALPRLFRRLSNVCILMVRRIANFVRFVLRKICRF